MRMAVTSKNVKMAIYITMKLALYITMKLVMKKKIMAMNEIDNVNKKRNS